MNNNHASDQPYLYQSVISCSNVLKLTKIKPITNNHYYVTHVTMANWSSEYSGFFFKNYEIRQCCHFLVNKCKIFKMLIETLFLEIFELDQSEIKEILQELVNIHNGAIFKNATLGKYILKSDEARRVIRVFILLTGVQQGSNGTVAFVVYSIFMH